MEVRALVTLVVQTLLTALPEKLGKELVDDLFDVAEEKIASTETEWDDATLLPMISKIRAILSIPDDIGGDED